MDVSDILRDRMQEPGGLQRMALVSAIAHGAIILAFVLAPRGWLQSSADAPKTVMTISLGGGTPGPANGGMTPMGGKAVQEAAPPEPKKEPPRPPAAKAPEMTMPLPKAKPTKAVTNDVKQAPDQAKARTPSKGEHVTSGSANVETGARGQGFGLSTGGGNGTGSTLDVADFCCPGYVGQMLDSIRPNWRDQSDVHDEVIIKFTIRRDGTLVDAQIEKQSRYTPNNLAAQRAIAYTRQIAPLPAEFSNPTLTVHLSFQYQ